MLNQSNEILSNAAIPGLPNGFFLGCFERRVTFYAQQVRALNLAAALLHDNIVRHNGRVAIVGGGIAGVTLAVAMARAAPNLKVELFERNAELLRLQRGARDRYVHPHIFDWPDADLIPQSAGLPLMNWSAGTAKSVVDSLDAQYQEARKSGNISERLNSTVNEIIPFCSGAVGIALTTSGMGNERYDAVILSIGFGLEKFLDHQRNPSYWQSSQLSDPLPFDIQKPKIFISGNGDGALADFSLASFNYLSHGDIIRLVLTHDGIDELKKILQEIDDIAWENDNFDIYEEYHTRLPELFPRHLISNIADKLRPDATIILHTIENKLFRRETAILNRFIAFLILWTDKKLQLGRVEVHVNKKLLSEPDADKIAIEGITPFKPEVSFLRFGPDTERLMQPFAALANSYRNSHPKSNTSRPKTPVLTSQALQLFAKFTEVYEEPEQPANSQQSNSGSNGSRKTPPVKPPFFTATAMSGQVTQFCENYLYSNDRPVVFGGRKNQISELNTWLASESESGRMLLTGPTGRGKSALLVRWIAQLDDCVELTSWKIVFVPISVRFGTSRSSVFYRLLVNQLSNLLNHPVIPPSSDLEEFYIGTASTLLRRANESDIKIAIVIDGLDEAIGDAFNSSIFPGLLQANLKILVSARQIAGDIGAEGWRTRLDWKNSKTSKAIILSELDRDGVQDVLISSGHDITALPTGLPDRLLELSQGDPLLIQLYVEDINELISKNCGLRLDQLSDIEPGYGPYILRWLDQQQQIWSATGESIGRRTIEATLAVLSCAFAPLSEQDLIHLVATLLNEVEPLSAKEYISPVSRFVIGSGTKLNGYILSHPKLGQYLREEYFPPEKVKIVHKYFVNWGDGFLLPLNNSNNNAIPSLSSYIIQHYTSHSEIIGLSLQRCTALLSIGWAKTWENFEGGFKGYSSDIRKVLKFAESISDNSVKSEFEAIKLRACLIQASIRSIGTNIPAELVYLGLKHEILTWRQAAHYIELQAEDNKPGFLSEVFPAIPSDERSHALSFIFRTKDVASRVQLLTKILGVYSQQERDEIGRSAISLLAKIEDSMQRSIRTMELARWYPELLSDLTKDALVATIPSEHLLTYSHEYARLAAALGPSTSSGARALSISIEFINQINSPIEKLIGAWNLSISCGTPQIIEFAIGLAISAKPYAENLVATLPDSNGSTLMLIRASQAYSTLAKQKLLAATKFDESSYTKEIEKILDLLSKIEYFDQPREVTNLLPLIRKSHFTLVSERAYDLAKNLPTGNNRTHALLELARNIDSPKQKDLVLEAIKNSKLIEDKHTQISARINFYEKASHQERDSTLPELINEINSIPYVVDKAKLFIKLSFLENEPLKTQLQEVAYHFIRLAFDIDTKIHETINLFSNASTPLRNKAFSDCWLLINGRGFSGHIGISIRQLADKFGDLWSNFELDKALSCLSPDTWEYRTVIPSLIPIAYRLNAMHVITMAQEIANNSPDPIGRCHALTELAPYYGNSSWYILQLNNAWAYAELSENSQKIGAWIKLAPLFEARGIKKRQKLIELILTLPENWNWLLQLAKQVQDNFERDEICKLVLASVMDEKPDTVFSTASQVVKITTCKEISLSAFKLITKKTGVPRTTFITSLENFSDLISEVGGHELIQKVNHDIMEVCNNWH